MFMEENNYTKSTLLLIPYYAVLTQLSNEKVIFPLYLLKQMSES